jgi:hypothetical protein
MNGISLKDLRWFSTFNDEYLESESLSIWQAVLFMLPYFDDDASVSYFNDLQRMESEVYEDLIIRLDKKGQPLLKDDTSPNYEHSYTEWDDMGNLLLSEEQIDEILPELNRSRMLVIERIEEADKIYQELKSEIKKSRDKRPTKIELIEDTLRDDIERVLIKRTSLDAVFPDIQPCKKEKPVYWHNIKLLIFYQLDLATKSKFSYMEFKAGNKILCRVERENSPFQGEKYSKPKKLFEILDDFRKPLNMRTHDFQGKNYRFEISKLKKLLKELTGLKDEPFYKKDGKFEPYRPKFKVEFREVQSRVDSPGDDSDDD